MQPQADLDIFQQFTREQEILSRAKRTLVAIMIIDTIAFFLTIIAATSLGDLIMNQKNSDASSAVILALVLPYFILSLILGIVGSRISHRYRRILCRLDWPQAKQIIKLSWISSLVSSLPALIIIAIILIIIL